MEPWCNTRFLRFFGATVCNGKETAKSRSPPLYTCMRVRIYICARTRVSPRREFSFHGQKDNPSLCHFSSVFLSHRLIELLRTAATDLCHVSFSPVSPFHRHTIDHETVVSRDTIRIYIYTHLFSPFRSWTKLDFVILSHLCKKKANLRYLLTRFSSSSPCILYFSLSRSLCHHTKDTPMVSPRRDETRRDI